ncbi:MAG: Bax inhibitor-1/YccA family protein [Acidobacteria bacterium]|nr:Bax inhibitor-1/YccA family protein [Acidobacteriota bacterium]
MARSLLSTEADLWSRSGDDTMTRRAFLGLIGLLTTYGLGVNAALAAWGLRTGFQPGLVLYIAILVLPFAGIFLARRAQSLPMQLVAYHLILVPFGLLLGPILQAYIHVGGMALVSRALLLTGATCGIMMLLGFSYPQVFSRLGGVLFASLLALIIVRVIGIFVPALGNAEWVDWLAAGIFTLYVGYDCYRAMNIPATGRNAVDLAISLYLDILNLFLTILRLLGRRD